MAEVEIESREKVKRLLKELFQFDTQDLDFGIYRIMNFKRKEIEKFIEEDLIKAAEEEFKEYARVGMVDLQKEIEKIRAEIVRDFGEGTIDEQGNVKKHEDAPKIKEYLSKRKELGDAKLTQAQIDDVFNHVYEFFSRYYDNGDFLSKRRYGGREKYRVPYNGEEVLLHWASNDQYYVKSGEYFKKYSFKAGGYLVNLVLKEAEADLNNVKRETRYFLLHEDKTVQLNEEKKELNIYFNWRQLSDEEKKNYGTKNIQEIITSSAIKRLFLEIGDKGPGIGLRKKVEGEVSTLERHITKYIEKNTTDYFVHKNLGSFLESELDFYIKNEVLDLDEIGHMDDKNIRMNTAKIRAIQGISRKIIGFLSQMEDFQKKLFEKKKFVTSVDYCITLDLIPEELYEEIGKNQKQVAEWKELFKLDDITKNTLQNSIGKKTLEKDFLKSNKYLVLDTRFFNQEFKDKLLGSFENLEESIEGLIIKSESFQALNLIKELYKEKIRCVYIDPPYNTGSDEFIYKDNYQHSCWLSMMVDRLSLARELMKNDGVIFVSIDEHETTNLRLIQDTIFNPANFLAQLVWKKKYTGGKHAKHFVDLHEYVLVYCNDIGKTSEFWMDRPEAEKTKFDLEDEYLKERGKYYIRPLKSNLGERPTLVYPIKMPDGNAITTQWIVAKDTFEQLLKEGRILFKQKRDGTWQVYRKYYEFDAEGRVKVPSILDVSSYNEGKEDYKRFFFTAEGRDIPIYTIKPVALITFLIGFATDRESIVLDFLAGTGTTANAVIEMNRKDGGKRRYILVEMDDFIFNDILKPRLMKAAYSKDWKDGTPVTKHGSSHMFKYMTLEQYEDTLNNVTFRALDKTLQETLDSFKDYFIRYMLDYETRESPTRLMVDKLQTPFDYKIKTFRGNQEKEETVDLVETFNYLLGLNVDKLRAFNDGERIYRVVFGKRNKEKIVVIWRNTKDIDLEKDKKFIDETILAGTTFDCIFINSDSYVKNARAIEPEFKKLMEA